MKKLFIVLALAALFTSATFAKSTAYKSTISYYSFPILKILDSRDAYVVIYQKNKIGTGSTVIPKKWSLPTQGETTKLMIRRVRNTNESYMSVYKKDGEFYRVVLNMPMNKSNPIWGLIDQRKTLEGTDKETLEDLEF